ncbi:MAG: amidohydrolase [Candidatus Hodarchaeales archaeon]|jgi:imidazolonepropionase-like amidohydrolase
MKAIINATILCPVQGIIEKGTILLDNGKIQSIGTNIVIPEGTTIIDATNKYVLPGFIDAHTHQGLFDGSIGWAGEDGNEMTDPITPEMRGLDSFNPFEPALKDLLKGGVTCINTGPGSGNVISGQALVVKPFGKIADDMVVLEPSGLKVAFGENPKRVYGKENKKIPSTRMGIAALLRKALTDAKNYIQEWEAYRKKAIQASEKDESAPALPKKDLKMEILAKVIRKEVPLHAHAHRADDIATAIRIAEEFDVKLVLIHCTEGHEIADYIAQKGVPAVVGPTIGSVDKPELRKTTFQTVVKLVQAGVKVALQTDSWTPMHYFQLLPLYVIKEGLTQKEALKSVTANPAEILGIEDRVGSLEPDKDADIVIWSGHPFEFFSRVEQIFINGKEAYKAD